MKIIRTLLLLLFILAFESPAKSNPNELTNWEILDYMIRGTVPFKYEKEGVDIELTKWDSKMLVALGGNYTISDSLELDKAMKAFNKIIPKLGIDWARNQNTASLIVQFVDLTNEFDIRHFNSYSAYGFYTENFLNHRLQIKHVSMGVLVIANNLTQEQRQSNIWSSFAHILIECNGNGWSLGSETVLGGHISNLTDFDRFFFSTIFADNFTDQYSKFLKDKYGFIDQYRYLTDNNTKNNINFSLQLILIFLLTYFFYQLLWVKYMEKKTIGKFARFYTSGMVFFTPQIIVSLFFITPALLKVQHFSKSILPLLIFGMVLFILMLALYFIVGLIAYFIEHVLFGNIHDFKQRQIVRIVSVSVIMIPLISINLILNRPQGLIGMQTLVVLLAFILIMVIRFLYFHDHHQKEIIQKHQQLKIEKLELLQTQFQLEAIQARTNPHFLYNSLNTIASLINIDTVKAEEFALKLSKLLRLRLNENKLTELPLRQELETIELYLEIEKERFCDRLEYEIVISENNDKLMIPTDILLYLVENSIKHGVSKQAGKGIVKVEITESFHYVTMSVADNGPDFPNNPIYGTGLKSILEKLEILYPDNFEFAIFNHPNKRVEIKFQRNNDER